MKPYRIAALLVMATLYLSMNPAARAAGPQQPSGTASVEGVVTRAGSGAPLPGIKVTLIFIPPPAPRPPQGGGGVSMIADRFSASGLPATITSSAPAAAASTGAAPPASSIPSALTDGKGAFAFRNLDAGTYRLTFAGDGFVPQEYGRTSSLTFANANSGSITLGAGQAMTGIAAKLMPTGNISGHVFDLNGRPLIGVPVNLYRPTYNPTGEMNPTTVATVRTNDRGEYRIFWIAPGRYFLVAGGNSATGRPLNSINNDVGDNFSYAFFPRGSDISEAVSIDIRPGSELSGSDIRVAPQAFYSIAGKVVDSRTGQPPANGSVSIAGRSPMGTRAFGGRNFYDPATGAFEITELPSGTYNVTSILNERPVGTPIGPNVLGAFAAAAIVRIANADVRDVVLTIMQGQAVSGQVQSDAPIPAGARMQVRLQPPSTALGATQAGAPLSPDGSFTFDSGAFRNGPGDYRINMGGNAPGGSGLPAGWYMKEVRLGNTDVTDNPVRLPADGALTVILSSKGGQVSGIVRNEQTQPIPRMYAVLIPESPGRRQDLILQMLTDPSGRFNFTNVPPGNYKLYAWEDVEVGTWFDPEWLKDWEQKGTPVRIAEGAREAIDIKSLPAGGLQ